MASTRETDKTVEIVSDDNTVVATVVFSRDVNQVNIKSTYGFFKGDEALTLAKVILETEEWMDN